MKLMHEELKSYSRLIILSFWLVQNLSYRQPLSPFPKGESEGFPTSGNDNLTHQLLEQNSL
jgi:hypothetical protein